MARNPGWSEPRQVVARARRILDIAQLGLADLEGPDDRRKVPGLFTAVVFGVSVIDTLKTLRSRARKAFNTWYKPFEAELGADAVCQYLAALRNTIVHEGGAELMLTIVGPSDEEIRAAMAAERPGEEIHEFRTWPSLAWISHPPTGGTLIEFYEFDYEARQTLRDLPKEFLGRPVSDPATSSVLRLYLEYLERIVVSAEAEFGEAAAAVDATRP